MSDKENPEEDNDDNLDPEDEEQNEVEKKDGSGRRRRRRRIKIRKRVRIKKKVSPKKKAKKMMETVAWILVIAAFIITLVVLVVQLDWDSKHRQKKKSFVPVKGTETELIAVAAHKLLYI